MSSLPLAKVIYPAALVSGTLFAALTLPFTVVSSEPLRVEIPPVLTAEIHPLFVLENRDFALRYLGISAIASATLGLATARWLGQMQMRRAEGAIAPTLPTLPFPVLNDQPVSLLEKDAPLLDQGLPDWTEQEWTTDTHLSQPSQGTWQAVTEETAFRLLNRGSPYRIHCATTGRTYLTLKIEDQDYRLVRLGKSQTEAVRMAHQLCDRGGTVLLTPLPSTPHCALWIPAPDQGEDSASFPVERGLVSPATAALAPGDALSQVQIQEQDWSGCDLSAADLSAATLDNVTLFGADLRGTNLRGAVFTQVDLRGADLRGADLSGAILQTTDLRGADLRQALLLGTQLHDLSLQHTRLGDAIADRTTQFPPNFDPTAARIHVLAPDAVLWGIDLQGVDLSGMDLRGANLVGANLGGTRLCGANLSAADLTGANLLDANLSYANLSRAILTDADLTDADLTDATLSGAIGLS